MKRSLPLVTIGIPTYNRASLVGRAIDSALAQDYPQLEIVVSNNASADGTEEACLARVAADSRLRYVQQDRNIGATRNFEEVLRLASGDYFMWLGDDDWIDPNYVRLCLDVLADDAYFLEGDIYEHQLKNKEKAMEIYRTFLDKYPGSVYAAEARKRFRTLRGDFNSTNQ